MTYEELEDGFWAAFYLLKAAKYEDQKESLRKSMRYFSEQIRRYTAGTVSA